MTAKRRKKAHNNGRAAHTKDMIKIDAVTKAVKEEFGDAADLIVMRFKAMGRSVRSYGRTGS